MKKYPQQKKNKPTQPVRPAPKQAKPSKNYSGWLIGISLALTLVAYMPAFNAGYVNWDDDDYVVNNMDIRSFSNAKELLTKPIQGNYHPLTMLSLAFSHALSGEKPWGYHLLNILLHLVNVFLVYKLASKLSKGNSVIAFATALLFGVHPMHVESVAWVSERKDVLYAFFFILGLMSYTKYVDEKKTGSFIMSIVWFLLSMASKPAAIIFPIALFTIDFLRARKLDVKMVLEKIPFLVFSGLLAWMTVNAQTTAGATDTIEAFPLNLRIFYACYGYMMYLVKLVFPVGLAAFYTIPALNDLPTVYYFSPIAIVATVALCLLTWKKYPVVTFAFAFFVVNLALVLQLKVIGGAVMADRYTYVPYISMFFLFGWLLDKKFQLKPSSSYMIIGAIGIVLTAVSFNQAKTWDNSKDLWDNAIRNAPSERAYVHRATFYRKDGNPDKALEYYNEALRLNKLSHSAFCNRANIYFDRGLDSLALDGYNHAIALKPDYVPAYDNRGALYAREGKYELALQDLNKAISLKKDQTSAILNRSLVLYEMGRHEESLRDCYDYLRYKPYDSDMYNSISVNLQRLGKYKESIDALNRAIQIKPVPTYFLNRSYSWNALGNMEEAKKDALQARQNGLEVPPAYAAKLGI